MAHINAIATLLCVGVSVYVYVFYTDEEVELIDPMDDKWITSIFKQLYYLNVLHYVDDILLHTLCHLHVDNVQQILQIICMGMVLKNKFK